MAEAKKSKKPEETEITDGAPQESLSTQDQTADQGQEVATKETAKAGKHSKKGLEEAEQKAKKEARKKGELAEEAENPTPKKVVKSTRPRAERAGKNYRESLKLVDKTKDYTLAEALELATKTSKVKFDASVELHIRLNVDPRQADQNIRDNLVLPEGTGKTVRVAVFGEADEVADAKKVGADIAGGDDFLAQLDKGKIEFDVLIASPKVMPKLAKYARLLGPKGLMPNPKSGTVTTDVAKAVAEAKAGKVDYRVDSTGIVHVAVGKVSFGAGKLQNNAATLLASLKSARPASVKGIYVKSIFVTTTMGPSIRVATSEI